MTPRVNPFAVVIIFVIVILFGYYMFDNIAVIKVDEQIYEDTASVVRVYIEEGVSTLENKTYLTELKTSKGDILKSQSSTVYNICKKQSTVKVTYSVTTYNNGKKELTVINVEKQ